MSRYSRVVITFGDLLEVVIPEDQFDVSNCANVERLNRQRQLQKYDQAVDERRNERRNERSNERSNERGNERRTERRQADQAIKPRILAIDNTVLAACIRL
jgi:protein subunit release factor B